MITKILKITAFLFILCSCPVFSQVLPDINIIKGDIAQSEGYYFIHSFKVNVPSAGMNSLILDKYGEIIYTKQFNYTASDFKVHPNGKMSYIHSVNGIPAALNYYIMDSTFIVNDSVSCRNGIFTDGHDLVILPSGGYLLMGYEFRVMNLSSYNWFNGNGSPGSPNANVKCGIIQELDANKNVVNTWKAADHYLFSDVQEDWLLSPTNVDWTHFNSIEMDNDGNYLVSVRHFSEVTKINRQTGDIIWRFGGKRNQFTVSGDPYAFYGQHDARRIANGNITVFDNGKSGSPVHPARGLEYNLNEQNFTASLVWSKIYSPNSFSSFIGSTRRLSNGNTIIGWGALRNANVAFGVYKPDGSSILEMTSPDTLLTYRAFNYSALPWALNRPVITCRDSAGSYYLDAPAGHSSYLWSTGSGSRSIRLNAADTFYVFVPYGEGGYISSERVIITDLGNPCSQVIGITPVAGNIPRKYSLEQNYPNPFNPVTKIKFNIPNGGYVKLKVFDISGREVSTLISKEMSAGSYTCDFDAGSLATGIYFYTLTSWDFTGSKKMLLIK